MKRTWKEQAAADIRHAADLIQTHGWSRTPYPGPAEDGIGPMCIATALCVTRWGTHPNPYSKSVRLRDARYKRAHDHLLRFVEHRHGQVICGFNQSAVNGELVVSTMRAAAAALVPPPVQPLRPLYASHEDRRRSMREWLATRGWDVGDDLVVEVPDHVPVEWVGVSR